MKGDLGQVYMIFHFLKSCLCSWGEVNIRKVKTVIGYLNKSAE